MKRIAFPFGLATVFIFSFFGTSNDMFGQSYTLTVHEVGGGTGVVTSSPRGINCGWTSSPDCSETYPAGKKVTLRAKPDPGSYFLGWSGGGCSGNKTCGVIMNQDTTVIATFGRKSPVLIFSPQTVAFDEIDVGQTDTETLTVTNSGTGDLMVTFSGLEGTEFSVSGSSTVAVKPQKSQPVKIKYKKSKEGDHKTKLKYESNDPNNPAGEIDVVELIQLIAFNLEIEKDIIFDIVEGNIDFYEHVTVDDCSIYLTLTVNNVVQGTGKCKVIVKGQITDKCKECSIDGSGEFTVVIESTSVYIPGSDNQPGMLSLDIREMWGGILVPVECWDFCNEELEKSTVPVPMPGYITYPLDIKAKDRETVTQPFIGIVGNGTYTWTIHTK